MDDTRKPKAGTGDLIKYSMESPNPEGRVMGTDGKPETIKGGRPIYKEQDNLPVARENVNYDAKTGRLTMKLDYASATDQDNGEYLLYGNGKGDNTIAGTIARKEGIGKDGKPFKEIQLSDIKGLTGRWASFERPIVGAKFTLTGEANKDLATSIKEGKATCKLVATTVGTFSTGPEDPKSVPAASFVKLWDNTHPDNLVQYDAAGRKLAQARSNH